MQGQDCFETQLDLFEICGVPVGDDIPVSSFGKMFQEPLVVTKDWILEPCSKKSQRPRFQCLKITNGQTQGWSNGTAVRLRGECWTHNIGESPNVEKESFLSQILEDTVPEKYYLSATAVIGILRRASKRGKDLPAELKEALIEQSGIRRNDYGEAKIANAGKVLRSLLEKIGSEAFEKWVRRIALLVQQKEVLFTEMFCGSTIGKEIEQSADNSKNRKTESAENDSVNAMCYLREDRIYGGTPQGRESIEQFAGELGEVMQELSFQTAPHERFMRCLWCASEGTPSMREALASVEEIKQAWLGYGLYGNDSQDIGGCDRFQQSAEDCVGNDVSVYVPDKARSLTARADGSPCIDRVPQIIAAGFKAGQSATSRSIGYSVEQSPTLGAEMNGFEPTVVVFDMTHANNPVQSYTHDVCHTLTARMGTSGNQVPVVSYAIAGNTIDRHAVCVGNGQLNQAKLSDKVCALNCMHDQQAVMIKKSVRRLTPLEAERLQGLEDNYTLIDDKSCSDTARYKALGNGMAQPCADYVIRRIVEVCGND